MKMNWYTQHAALIPRDFMLIAKGLDLNILIKVNNINYIVNPHNTKYEIAPKACKSIQFYIC